MNTDKTNVYACDMKVKTRGIQLALTNCGIIVAYRELYGSESTTQVALVYLDLCDNFLSKQALNQLNYYGFFNINGVSIFQTKYPSTSEQVLAD